MNELHIPFPYRTGWLVLPFLAASLALQLPGNVPYDGIVVWHEADTQRLYAQHPAALVLVWYLAERLLRGPAAFTLLQLAALWGAAALIVARWRPAAALLFLGILLLWPPSLAMSGVTVKDVFGAHLCLLAFALALPRLDRAHRPWLWAIVFALAALAALLRYQLALILPVLATELWWDVRRFRSGGAASAGMAALGLCGTIGAVSLAVSMLFVVAGSGDMRQSLRKIMIYDIAGVVVHDPAVPLADFSAAGIAADKLKILVRRSYSPVRVDTLWQENGQGSALFAPRGVFAMLVPVPDSVLLRQWRHAIAADPAGFLAHRLHTFARVLGLGDIYACRPIRAGISPQPAAEAAAVRASSYRPAVSAQLMQSRYFPARTPFRSWIYVLIGLALLIAGRFGVPREAVLLAGFALVYEASFLVLPQACEVRYSYPSMLAVVAAVALWLGRPQAHSSGATADDMVGAAAGTG